MNVQTLYDMAPWDWPEETAKILQDILENRSADPAERLLAAEMAGEMVVVDDDLAKTLLAVVADNGEAAEMRARAAISLGPALEHADTEGFDDPEEIVLSEEVFRRILEEFRQIFNDPGVPKEVRRRILEAAVRAPRPWQLEAIGEAFAGDDPQWRLTAVFCMRFVEGFERQILKALQSDDPAIHFEAVIAAGNWQIEEAWPDIAALLTEANEDRSLLFAAIEAAANLGLPEAIEPLEDLLLDCEDDDLIDALHESLAMLHGYTEGDSDEEDDW